jgi:hypothetical protein
LRRLNQLGNEGGNLLKRAFEMNLRGDFVLVGGSKATRDDEGSLTEAFQRLLDELIEVENA